jgi:nitrate/nitrite-specific signal transduction histidine kinase
MIKSPRKIRNYLIRPGYQLRFGLYFITSGLALLGVMIAVIFSKLRTLSETISRSGSLDIKSQTLLNNLIFEMTWISLLTFVAFALIVLVYSIVISHRIVGPTVAICAYIEELKKGNLDARRTLRKYDELHPIMDALQEFALLLKSKK